MCGLTLVDVKLIYHKTKNINLRWICLKEYEDAQKLVATKPNNKQLYWLTNKEVFLTVKINLEKKDMTTNITVGNRKGHNYEWSDAQEKQNKNADIPCESTVDMRAAVLRTMKWLQSTKHISTCFTKKTSVISMVNFPYKNTRNT